MQQRLADDSVTLAVELGVIGLAYPIMAFSTRFPAWATVLALFALVGGWVWRRVRLGYFWTRTPIDLPIVLLFGMMLPIAVWAAPDALRTSVSVPRALVMLWAFCLFVTVVTYASGRYQAFLQLVVGFSLAGAVIAGIALLGTRWLYKFSGTESFLSVIPAPLRGAFVGAEAGFHPNQVAGTLLYVFPLLIAVVYWSSARRGDARSEPRSAESWTLWVFGPAAVIVGLVLLMTQSRAALAGLTLSLLFMALVNYRWGRVALVALLIALIVTLPFAYPHIVQLASDAPTVEAVGGVSSIERFRTKLWTQAIRAVSDFPLTGMGLGTFRELARVLYPLSIPPAYDIGHAHNFFLQTALDFGIPGLIAVLAMYIVTLVQLTYLWSWSGYSALAKSQSNVGAMPGRVWAVGFAGCFVAQTVYSMLDAVAMGAKTNFMLWYLMALVMGLANYAAVNREGSVSSRNS